MSECKKSKRLRSVLMVPLRRLTENKCSFAVYLIAHILIVITIVRGCINNDSRMVSISFLAIALMLSPLALKLLLRIRFSAILEIMVYLFVFSAQMLGEIHHFYSIFPFWDAVLHVISGFMFAALGYSLVDVFHQKKPELRRVLSPLFITFMAFCFSMTVGVFWEFIEFGGDNMLGKDMQKDTVVQEFHTILIPNEMQEYDPTRYMYDYSGINTVIYDSEGNVLAEIDGHLDIGLIDTMKDMALNFAGALLFCIIGYFGIKSGKKSRLAALFIPMQHTDTANNAALTESMQCADAHRD